MEILIKNSTAYKIFCREADAGRLAHAYMLSFEDGANLREALKIFALKYFSTAAEERCGGQIMREVYPDCKIYPEPGKKFNAEAAVALIEDSAMRPTVGEKKLYIISSFEDCSPIVQNKLLKVIEEPPAGVGFILGATTLSPVLSTILSRVRLLEIAPFTQQQIFEALERRQPGGELNRLAAESCGGVFGDAVALAAGQFSEIHAAAAEILSATDAAKAGALSLKYADTKLKKPVIAEIQRLCYRAARTGVCGGADSEEKKIAAAWSLPALIKGAEIYGGALRDIKFNAYYSALLYGAMLSMIEENTRWQKL